MSSDGDFVSRSEFKSFADTMVEAIKSTQESNLRMEAAMSDLLAKIEIKDRSRSRSTSPTSMNEGAAGFPREEADQTGAAGMELGGGKSGVQFESPGGCEENGALLEGTVSVEDRESISVDLVADAVCVVESLEEATPTVINILPAAKSTFECRSWWKCTKDNCLHCRARDRLDTLARSGSIKYPNAFQRPLYSRTSVFKYRSFPEWSVPVRPEDLKNSSCYQNYWRWVLGKIHSYWFYAGETMHKSIFVNTIIHIARMRIVWDPGG